MTANSVHSLINPNSSYFDQVYAKFRWRVPSHFNIANSVCDRHRNLAGKSPCSTKMNEVIQPGPRLASYVRPRTNSRMRCLVRVSNKVILLPLCYRSALRPAWRT